MKYQQTIGIIGGMGSYATLDLFRRLLEAFPAEKEWDRPRILIDNRCTMPSRVRAILYQEERPALVSELAKAAQGLMNCGTDHLVFACNTSHVFLDEVFSLVPEARGKTVHLIRTLAEEMLSQNVTSAYLLATEGTIEAGIYQEYFNNLGIKLKSPNVDGYVEIWAFIEDVKQHRVSPLCREHFYALCDAVPDENIILGCTELPIVAYGYYGAKKLWDPLDSVIRHLKKTIH